MTPPAMGGGFKRIRSQISAGRGGEGILDESERGKKEFFQVQAGFRGRDAFARKRKKGNKRKRCLLDGGGSPTGAAPRNDRGEGRIPSLMIDRGGPSPSEGRRGGQREHNLAGGKGGGGGCFFIHITKGDDFGIAAH